jgi:c-di-GMP-binding flagellar brake protein YcgR
MDEQLRPLWDAIDRSAGAVVSLPTGGTLRHFKSRFLRADGSGFWVQSPGDDPQLADHVIALGQLAGVSFMAGQAKVVFAAQVLERRPDFCNDEQGRIEALLLRWPEGVRAVQRRSNHRAKVPLNSVVSVRAWRMSKYAALRDRPSPSSELDVRARDLSVGGIGLLVMPPPPRQPLAGQTIPQPEPGRTAALAVDQRLRVEVRYEELEILVEGRVCHVNDSPDLVQRVGVQFRYRESAIDGKQILWKLTRIVGHLHREEVRRWRLGLAG